MIGLRDLDPVTAERRLRAVRAVVAGWSVGWLVVRLPHLLDLPTLPDRRWYPVGVLAPLDTPPPVWLARGVVVLALLAGVAATAGWRPRVSVPLWAGALLLVGTYVSCWGQLFHTEHLLVLHALVLAGWALATRPVDARLVLTALVVVVVIAYVVAGVAKLRGSGWSWFEGDVLRNKVAFDNLRKAVLGAPASPFAQGAVGQGWLWAPLAAFTLAVELGAPLALLHPRVAVAWAAAAWSFHVGVLALMHIVFPYPLAGLAFAPLFPLERLRELRRRRRPEPGSPR